MILEKVCSPLLQEGAKKVLLYLKGRILNYQILIKKEAINKIKMHPLLKQQFSN